jgi:hypothetical protein
MPKSATCGLPASLADCVCDRTIKETLDRFGGLDILINSVAGSTAPSGGALALGHFPLHDLLPRRGCNPDTAQFCESLSLR